VLHLKVARSPKTSHFDRCEPQRTPRLSWLLTEISIDDSDMRSVYGEGVNSSEVLTGTRQVPGEVQAFPMALGSYSIEEVDVW